MSIGRKLTIALGALVAISFALVIALLFSITAMRSSFDEAVNRTAKKIVLADRIDGARSDMMVAQRGMMQFTYAKDVARVQTTKQQFQSEVAGLLKTLDEFEPLIVTDDVRQLSRDIRGLANSWVPVFNSIDRLCQAGNTDAAIKMAVADTFPIYQQLGIKANRLTEIQMGHLEQNKADASSLETKTYAIAITLFVFALLASGAGLWLVRNINLTLHDSVRQLSSGASGAAQAAGQVSAASQALAQGASEQAASLEETSASTEEISSMARKNTANSKTAADVTTASQQKFVEANRALQETVAAMDEINQQSSKISKIIKTIDEIAFQTNILALNAAVEAARAGEAGMGFAVVADEVRSLAQRSAQAARETAELIEESIAKSDNGKVKVDHVVVAVKAISEQTAEVKILVDEVSAGSREQANGIEQIGRGDCADGAGDAEDGGQRRGERLGGRGTHGTVAGTGRDCRASAGASR